MPKVLGKKISRVLLAYYRGPDHPMKLRLWGWFRQLTRYPRLTQGAKRLLSSAPPKAIVFESSYNSDPGLGPDPLLIRELEGFGYRIAWIPRPSGLREPRGNFLGVHSG